MFPKSKESRDRMTDDSDQECDEDCFQTVTYASLNTSLNEDLNIFNNTTSVFQQQTNAMAAGLPIFCPSSNALTYTACNIRAHPQDVLYVTTPRGSVNDLHSIRIPNVKEDYYRLSQSISQHHTIANNGLGEFENVRKELLDRSDSSNYGNKKTPTYFKLSLLSLLIFFPFGIVAVIKSRQAYVASRSKDHISHARNYADAARFFATLGIIIGLIIIAMTFAFRLKYMFNEGNRFSPLTR